MSIDNFAARLNDLEIFRGLAPAQIAGIVRDAERMSLRDGHAIVTAGASGDGAYLIVGGEAVVVEDPTDAGPSQQRVPAGSLLGEMAMLIEHAYAVTIVCRGPVRALKLNRGALHRQMAADPDLAEHFVSRIASRLTRVAVELRRIDQMLAMAGESKAPAPM